MRCPITATRKLKRLSAQVGFRVDKAMTRGGTDHRIDMWDAEGRAWSLHKDGWLQRHEDWDAKIGWKEMRRG